MNHIANHLSAVTPLTSVRAPSARALRAIEAELPLIAAEIDLLDAEIAVLDRVPTELDERRLRRARNRVLAARRALADRAATRSGGVA